MISPARTRACRIRVHGVLVALFAAGVLVGHLLDLSLLTSWFGTTEMSIPSAFCLLLLAASDIELSLTEALWKEPPNHA